MMKSQKQFQGKGPAQMVIHFIALEQQGIKVFLTPDGIAWLSGEPNKTRLEVKGPGSNRGQKIVFTA